MNFPKLLNYFLRVLAAATLAYWSFKNLYPIELFESRLVEQGLSGWYGAPLIARLFIAAQWITAVFLLLNFNFRRLLFFSFLLWLVLCGWDIAWEFMKDNKVIIQSYGWVVKNQPVVSVSIYFGMLAGGILLYFQKSDPFIKARWFKHIVWVPLLVLPFILNPVYPSDFSERAKAESQPFEFGSLDSLTVEKLHHQPVLVAFFSTNCRFCKQAVQRMEIALRQSPDFPKVHILFTGDEKGVQHFKSRSHDRFEYSLVDDKKFWDMSGPRLPSFAWVENDTIRKRWDGHTFNYYTMTKLSRGKEFSLQPVNR